MKKESIFFKNHTETKNAWNETPHFSEVTYGLERKNEKKQDDRSSRRK
jgi:hypothetical protein